MAVVEAAAVTVSVAVAIAVAVALAVAVEVAAERSCLVDDCDAWEDEAVDYFLGVLLIAKLVDDDPNSVVALPTHCCLFPT